MRKGWSINAGDWNRLESELEASRKWHSVLLTPNDRQMVPDRPGVYVICVRPPVCLQPNQNTVFDKLSSPIYIGRSATSIRTRFLAHCTKPEPVLRTAKLCYKSVQIRFWYMELPPAHVKSIEAQLIECFGPPANLVSGTIAGRIGAPEDP